MDQFQILPLLSNLTISDGSRVTMAPTDSFEASGKMNLQKEQLDQLS